MCENKLLAGANANCGTQEPGLGAGQRAEGLLFGAVMMEEENCRRFLELALRSSIERAEVSKEKSTVYHPEYKGVRLDV